MSKPVFIDGVTVVDANFLNSIYGQGTDGGHDHLGEDRLGSASQISLDELTPTLQGIINDLIASKPIINQLVHNGSSRVPLFGGSGKDGEFNGQYALNNPLYEFTNFTIPAGTNVLVERGFVRIKCTGNFTIRGTLVGLAINQYGLGDAWYSDSGQVYNPLAQMYGSGGGETVDHTTLSGLTVIRDRGGNGGSGIIVECLGNILIEGSIICNGADGKQAQIISGSNHVLGGSGGGSGGLICLQSFSSIDLIGKLIANGGSGANGVGTNAGSGGGGGGGWIRCIAPTLNGTVQGNVEANGGISGNSTGTGSNLGAGGGSFGGKGGASKVAGNSGIASLVSASTFAWW